MKFDLLQLIAEQDANRVSFTRMLYVVPYYKRLQGLLDEFVSIGILHFQASPNMRNHGGHPRKTYGLTAEGRILFEKMEQLNEMCPLDKIL